MKLVIEGCAIATVDAAGTEHADGHIVIEDGRITAVGEGSTDEDGTRIDGRGMLATPGLVNCHHHLYQWATRGMSQQSTLFEWLQELYPVWARVDGEIERAAARAGLAALARSGCSTSTDHHYVFPRGAGDLLAIEVEAARELHVRFHPCRGSMDLGKSQGGLPPDEVTEDRDAILQACADAIDRFHDPAPDAMVRVALAPCSPFSVTKELMAETAEFARQRGTSACTPTWPRRSTRSSSASSCSACGRSSTSSRSAGSATTSGSPTASTSTSARSAASARPAPASRTARPRTRGSAPASRRWRRSPRPARRSASASTAPASNEAGELAGELREALLVARIKGGPQALTAREALALGTIHGARCLGREDEIGSLEPGKLADVALWQLGDLDHAGIADPVAALVLGARPIVDTLLVGGRPVVEHGRLTTADEEEIARDIAKASRRMQEVVV